MSDSDRMSPSEREYQSVLGNLPHQQADRVRIAELVAEIGRLRGMLGEAEDCVRHAPTCYSDTIAGCTCGVADVVQRIDAYWDAVGEQDAICQKCGQAVAAETDAMIAHECRDAAP